MSIFEQENEYEDVSIFELTTNYVMEAILLENIGCIVSVEYEYLQITKDEIAAYESINLRYPPTIYKAWDARNRALLAGSMEIATERFEVTADGDFVYNVEDLIGGVLLGVTVEGIGIDESNPAEVEVNTVTGDVTIKEAITGQKVLVTFKKALE